MQQVDDPPYLQVGTEVSAKYKGAFCEAKVSEVVRNIKVKVAYKQGLGSGVVSDDDIKATPGQLRVGAVVEVRHPDRKDYVEATVTKIQDCSQYTVVFDDGDITTLRRTALCLKSGRHFNESETLDQLPLTHPEHFGNPVVGGRRGRRRGHMNDGSSDEDDESDAKEVVNEKEEHIGKVVCVETESKKKDKEKWFPGLVVAPTAQATVRIRVKDEYLVRSFKDGRYYTVPKKEATGFTREAAAKQDGPAIQAALEYLDSDVLPPHWERDALFALSNTSSENEDEIDSDSSDDEPREEKDRFVAQLYKYMDDRGTPLNKVPSIQNKDVDLYRLFRAVQKRGGYNRVTAQNQWKSIAVRLGFAPVTVSITNLVKQAYKKFLQPYGEFHRKLGCSMLMSPRNSNRSKGRSLVRANSVASPKPQDTNRESSMPISKLATNSTSSSASTSAAAAAANTSASLSTSNTNVSITEESENTSESSSQDNTNKTKRKSSLGGSSTAGSSSGVATTTTGGSGSNKVKGMVEKYEEKNVKDDGDVPLSKIKAAAAASSNKEKSDEGHKEKEKEREKEREAKAEKEKEKEKDKDSGSSKDSSGHATRDSSPSGSNVSSKKDKTQRKQSSQSDDKRNKRRKDEIVVEKIDTGDFVVETGDKLKVYYHEKKVTYEAKVLEITLQRNTPMYLVHYTGWNNRYDEWVPRERIAENLTKGSKFKSGRSSNSNEKAKENPPKPPTASSFATSNSSGGASSSNQQNVSSSTAAKTPTAAAKRGRGRSDSMPPRSTTPSSVASNSSRTKSPATSSALKKRPQRQMQGNMRRTSANVSDVSMATEEDSDTDSDEPVKRPNRPNIKDAHKNRKSPGKSKMSISAPNSQSESDENDEDDDDEEEEEDMPTTSKTATPRKGRDYDLSQIRSELKGFETIKATNEMDDSMETKNETKDSLLSKIKTEKPEFDSKSSTNSATSSLIIKEELKSESKEEPNKRSSTEMSSETDSFGDDESQSSDKTTKLENMRKKFQQLINADKSSEKSTSKTSTFSTGGGSSSGNRVVEKIIKERDSDKRNEQSKAKITIKEEIKPTLASLKMEMDMKKDTTPMKDEEKKSLISTIVGSSETKCTLIQPTRFPSTATSSITPSSTPNKYASVIVEKPLSAVKKLETSFNTKKLVETPKKSSSLTESQMSVHTIKKFIEPNVHKEILKVEPPAACSPSSTSSTSSSTSSSSSSATSTGSSGSRFLPDMSKLDISGTSSSSNSTSSPSNSTSSSSTTSYASAIAKEQKASNIMAVNKPPSPDIYEFKDTEPFEFEIRKSPMVAAASSSGSSVITANLGSSLAASLAAASSSSATTSSGFTAVTGPPTPSTTQRLKANVKTEHHIPMAQNPMSTIVKSKKRGSPMKESVIEKSKLLKLEEKPTTTPSPLVQDAKLVHHSTMASSAPSTAIVKNPTTSGMAKTATTIMHAPALPKTTAPLNTPASSASSLLAPVITVPQKLPAAASSSSTETPSVFDALRKSPSFNLNINALNEELAQTVQETTRALTDALQTPQSQVIVPNNPNESTPTKTIIPAMGTNLKPTPPLLQTPPPPSTVPQTATTTTALSSTTTATTIQSPKLTTPPSNSSNSTTAKPQVGSPFIETRSVFELSFGAGTSGRENKFELENAKVLLSATGGVFDLDVSKLETKPSTSSIADKVLKAISQKKEEEENKKQEESRKEKEGTPLETKEPGGTSISGLPALPIKSSLDALTPSPSNFPTTSSVLLSEPLKINTDLSSTGAVCTTLLSGPLNSFLANKRTPLTSPEPKMGILESMGGTKNQLSETIQKLECAIQRRTPVTSHPVTPTTPLSTTNPETFSEDSNDSTDSERRLVIEDVVEEPTAPPVSTSQSTTTTLVEHKPSPVTLTRTESPKTTTITPPVGSSSSLPIKLESTTMVPTKIAYAAQHDIPAPIPIKAVTAITATRATITPTVASNPTNIVNIVASPSLVVNKPGTGGTVAYPSSLKPVIQTNPQSSASGSVSATSSPQSIQKSVVVMSSTINLQTTTTLPSASNEPPSISSNSAPTNVISTPQKTNQAARAPATQTSGVVTVSSAGVPIDLPDIPASVVVASSAVPSVMAAAQAAAAALQTSKQTPQKQTPPTPSLSGNIPKPTPIIPISTAAVSSPMQSLITPVQSSGGPTAFVATTKSFENSTTIRPVVQPQIIKPNTNTSGGIPLSTPTKTSGGFHPITATCPPASTSGFYLDPRTELRPDDGLKPLIDIPKPLSSSATIRGENIITTTSSSSSNLPPMEVASNLTDTHSDSINQLRCEETIPGSPASVIAGREDSQERTATSLLPDPVMVSSGGDKDFSVLSSSSNKTTTTTTTTAEANMAQTTSVSVTGVGNVNSSPNDSGSQEDESSEDIKKDVDLDGGVSPQKRRRTRKQGDVSMSVDQQQQQQQQQHHQQQSKRRRAMTINKNKTAGSDSDDNSDNISQRSAHTSRHNLQQQSQTQQGSSSSGSKPCPYNFLVQLDPSLSSDQCIAILLKQIQDLRKTYNIIKSDLASIDRRRKKLRRREREKKQLMQSQQQMKVGT
ncbi:mucin-2 [Musca vetustissima]|uniref:mucin-2 n=1 Tax=Musca vetustissima TaxID=27455 RepID=UPI002AB6CE9A|nr:mucin-2 [Musca vetustissima]